jgi:hypothetical protein
MQVTLAHNNNNVEFLKFYSKCLTFCIFYLEKMSNLVDLKAKEGVSIKFIILKSVENSVQNLLYWKLDI